MSPVHYESVFGDAIVAAMVERGWREGRPQDYRADLGLDTRELFAFIGATQGDEWDELRSRYGDADAAQAAGHRVAVSGPGAADIRWARRGVGPRLCAHYPPRRLEEP